MTNLQQNLSGLPVVGNQGREGLDLLYTKPLPYSDGLDIEKQNFLVSRCTDSRDKKKLKKKSKGKATDESLETLQMLGS